MLEADAIKQTEMKEKKNPKKYFRKRRKPLETKLQQKSYQIIKYFGSFHYKIFWTLLRLDKSGTQKYGQ